MLTRRSALGLMAIAPVTLAAPMRARAATPEVYAEGGVAINGFDPVAYFLDAAPVEGLAEHTVDFKGATWRFASAENAEMFKGAPEDYAPQFGGYCAYAVSRGGTATTSPDAWTVHNDKLYLNYNTTVRSIWLEDVDANIAAANDNWPGVLG